MTEPTDNPRGLHRMVVHNIGQRIASGELADGTQIIPEDLCEQFSVSRPVVREALRVLESKGMVRPRPRTGTRVLPLVSWNLLDQDVIGWRVMGPRGAAQLTELSELRAAVEVYAARKCAEHATPEQIAALRAACDEMATTGMAGDLSGFTAADIVFHTVILEASANAAFRHFAVPFAAFLHARENLHTLPDQVSSHVVDDHRLIIDAIERHDGEAAEALSRNLIEKAQLEIEERIGPGG